MRTLFAAAGAWLLIAGYALVSLWPTLPATPRGWLALLVLGPPAVLAGEFIAAILTGKSAVDGKPRRYGWKALVLAVLAGLAYVAALVWSTGP